MSASPEDTRNAWGWRACSQAYLHLRFGVDVWEHPYGIGDCEIPLEEACRCYLECDFLDPITRGELVWAITAALSRVFVACVPSDEQLCLAKRVMVDAQHQPWAIDAIDSSVKYNEQVDPGDFSVDQWLRSLSELDFEAMRRRRDEFFLSAPNTENKAKSAIEGPHDTSPEQQD